MDAGGTVVDDDGVAAVGWGQEPPGRVGVPGGQPQAADVAGIATTSQQFGLSICCEHRGGQVDRRSHSFADQLDIDHFASSGLEAVPVLLVRLDKQATGLAGDFDLLGGLWCVVVVGAVNDCHVSDSYQDRRVAAGQLPRHRVQWSLRGSQSDGQRPRGGGFSGGDLDLDPVQCGRRGVCALSQVPAQ